MEKFDWLQQWPGLRDLLAQYGFTLPEGLAGQADFIRWLREQQAALARQDSSPEKWPELIDRLDEMGILRATDGWLIETASKDDRKPPLSLAPRLHTPAAGIVRGAFGAGPFAHPVATGNALVAWQRLRVAQQGRPLHASFSPTTGLVRSLASPSFVAGPATTEGAKAERAHWFIANYGGLLHGDIENDANKTTPWRQTGAVGAVVYFQQLAGGGIPVYGATAAFSFDDNGELRFIQNGWYPVASDKPLTWQGELDWDAAVERAVRFLQEHGALPKGHEVKTVFGSGSEEGRVFLPTFDKGTEHAGDNRYLPAWSVLVVDYAGGNAWEVLVDAATGRIFDPEWRGDPRPEKLQLTLLAQVWAYENNEDARDDKVWLTDWAAGGSPLDPLNRHYRVFSASGDFSMIGVALPAVPADPPTLEELRAGNAFYHLCKAAGEFANIRAAAWPAAGASLPPLPGSDLPLTVAISTKTGALYLPDSGAGSDPSGVLYLRPGSQSSNIDDQMLDCEVLYHEYAHAVLHQVRRQIVENCGAGFMQANFRPAVNEGLAFYFAAALADRLSPGRDAGKRWGEYAYDTEKWELQEPWFLEHSGDGKQQEGWDYLPDPESFPSTGDPFPGTDHIHLCGMILARALWDVRSILGPETDPAVLRAASMLGGIPDGLLPPAEAFQQRVRELHPDAYEKALRLLWFGRGIVADAPVNAFVRLELASHSYTFAAATRGDSGSGCFYVKDSKMYWTSLGTGGPHEMVALAAVDVVRLTDGSRTILFAAGDRWSPFDGGAVASGKLYSYVLNPAGFSATATWQPLGVELPGDVSVLSLAAQPTGSAAFRVYAATTGGLYRIAGSWQGGTSLQMDSAWLGLSEDPALGVTALVNKPGGAEFAVADGMGGHVEDANSNVLCSGPSDWALCTAAVDQQVWVGTREGVYRFELGAGSNLWQEEGRLGDALPPVLCLLPGGVDVTHTELLAGTSAGLYKWTGAAWTEVLPNELGMVTCLGHTPNGRVLAVTAGRGLQRLTTNLGGHAPFYSGLPRAGAALDIEVSAGGCPYHGTLGIQDLPAGGIATYVLSLPAAACHLRLSTSVAISSLKAYYRAPYIDLDNGKWAGLQGCELDSPGGAGPWTTHETVKEGYYLIILNAAAAGTSSGWLDVSLVEAAG